MTKKIQIATIILGFNLIFTSNAFSALKYDSNVPQAIQAQMESDLQFIKGIQGSAQTAFHKEIFGNVDGASYSQFFEQRVRSVGLSTCGNANAVACVQMIYFNKMWLTDNFIKFSHPQISRLMVVFHEARHTELAKGGWAHDKCPVPFLDENGKDKVSIWTGAKLEGEAACDSKYQGSYGSSTIMLKNIAQFCSNCSSKVKMDADMYAMDQLGRVNNESVKKAMIADFNAN